MLHDVLQDSGINGTIRRLTPGDRAIHRVRQTGEFRRVALPDLVFFDFSNADRHNIAVLRDIAFGPGKSTIPVILLTSPQTETLLDSGDIDGGSAVMLTPTSLSTCARRMHASNRTAYFKALRIFYEFGPILVRTPEHVLAQEALEDVTSA